MKRRRETREKDFKKDKSTHAYHVSAHSENRERRRKNRDKGEK